MPAGLAIGLHLGFHIGIVLIHRRPPHQHRIVALQGVGRDPGLDGRTSPTVDNDALRHTRLLKHPLAEEIAYGGERPGVLLVQGLPVDVGGTYVILHAMGVGIVLHSEQADLRILVGIDLLDILRIDPLDMHVNIRLS